LSLLKKPKGEDKIYIFLNIMTFWHGLILSILDAFFIFFNRLRGVLACEWSGGAGRGCGGASPE